VNADEVDSRAPGLTMNEPNDTALSWFERRKNQDRIYYALCAACGALVFADFAYHPHAHFSFETWFAFHAGFGFVAYVAIVTTAKGLRRLVRRSEDYYGE
jgi:uncharacterized OB-fold protein